MFTVPFPSCASPCLSVRTHWNSHSRLILRLPVFLTFLARCVSIYLHVCLSLCQTDCLCGDGKLLLTTQKLTRCVLRATSCSRHGRAGASESLVLIWKNTVYPCLCTTLTPQCNMCRCLRLGVFAGMCVGPWACPKEVVHLSICMRSLCGTMSGLIPVQLWSQTGSPVTPHKTAETDWERKRGSLRVIVTATGMPLLFDTKDRGERGGGKENQGERKTEKERFRGGKHALRQTWTSHTGPAGGVYRGSSTADGGVNKQHGTSERCEQDCVKELRM